MFRWLARTLAVAALAPLALPAHAVADQTFTASGSVTYTWQGDPASGCAAVGVCGVQGALILQSQGSGSSTGGGPPRGTIDVPIESTGSTVRVADGSGAGECVDVASLFPGGDLLITRRTGGGLVGHIGPSVSSGRCAGPLEQDLAALMLPVRRSGGQQPTFDLRANRSFVVGPFAVTLASTLVVRTARGAGGSKTVSSVPGPVQRLPTHKVLLEQVTLHYRTASLPGTLNAAFSGEPDPFCATLDACGATGTLALSLTRFHRTLVVNASRPAAGRVDAREALADFRRGRLQATGIGFALGGSTAQLSETFAGSGGLRCQDTVDSHKAPLFLSAEPARPGGGVSLVLNNPVGSDLLRTYCPGPLDSDVFGASPGVARASIGVTQLLARHSVVALADPGSFAGVGYVGSRSGALAFSLTLELVHAGTVEVVRP